MTTPAPRPFYIIGHDTNTIADVKRTLSLGGNAIECDLQLSKPSKRLCVDHDPPKDMACNPLLPYLRNLRALADASPELALVIFDCKVDDPAVASRLLEACREHLTRGTTLNVLFSLPKFENRGFFRAIAKNLGEREGVMIDDDDPKRVSAFFDGHGVQNHGYGGGVRSLASGPDARPTIELATAMKGALGKPRWVYARTLEASASLRDLVRTGVDGILSERVDELARVIREPELAASVRLAERRDNPFQPATPNHVVTDSGSSS